MEFSVDSSLNLPHEATGNTASSANRKFDGMRLCRSNVDESSSRGLLRITKSEEVGRATIGPFGQALIGHRLSLNEALSYEVMLYGFWTAQLTSLTRISPS